MNKLLIFMNIMFIGAILWVMINIMTAPPAKPLDIIMITLGMFGLFVGNYLEIHKRGPQR